VSVAGSPRASPAEESILFRRPLFSDPLVVIALCGLSVVLGWSLNGNVEWGGSYSPERMAAFLGRAMAGGLLLLVLVFFLALMRLPLQRPGSSARAGEPAFGSAGGPVSPGTAGPASTSAGERVALERVPSSARTVSPVPSPGPLPGEAGQELSAAQRDDAPSGSGPCGQCRADGGAGRSSAGSGPLPRLREIGLDRTLSAPDEPLRIMWWFDEAHSVTVDGRRGFPPCGSDFLNADVSREIVVTAHGDRACRTVRLAIEVSPRVPGGARFSGESLVDLRALETGGASPSGDDRERGSR
jgi:hypothetical protein